MGITAVFDELNGNCRSDTYTHFPSRLHESSGAEERAMPDPKVQLSHTVIGAPPPSGTAKDIKFLSPCAPGGVTPTRAQRLSGDTLCSCMMSMSETATWPLPSSSILMIFASKRKLSRCLRAVKPADPDAGSCLALFCSKDHFFPILRY